VKELQHIHVQVLAYQEIPCQNLGKLLENNQQNVGMLEYRNNGKTIFYFYTIFQHSIIPSFVLRLHLFRVHPSGCE
jgi:hypothetical protein